MNIIHFSDVAQKNQCCWTSAIKKVKFGCKKHLP